MNYDSYLFNLKELFDLCDKFKNKIKIQNVISNDKTFYYIKFKRKNKWESVDIMFDNSLFYFEYNFETKIFCDIKQIKDELNSLIIINK